MHAHLFNAVFGGGAERSHLRQRTLRGVVIHLLEALLAGAVHQGTRCYDAFFLIEDGTCSPINEVDTGAGSLVRRTGSVSRIC